MKPLFSLLLLALGSALVSAKPPENYPPSRYIDLYKNSPFTDPPPEPEPEVGPNDLDDWTLAGIRKSVDAVVVTVINTKSRERVTIPGKKATDMGFAIKEVKQQRNFLESKVTLIKGKQEGEVGYDPKFLVLRAIASPPPQAGAGAPNPGNRGAQPATNNGRTPPVPGTQPNAKAAAVPAVKTSTSVPTPTRAAAATTTNSTKKSSRTRYVPRPKK